MLFSWLFLGVALLLIVKSIKVIGPKEMAVSVRIGKPIGFLDSGINFVLVLIYSLAIFPKKLFNFDYLAKEIITKADVYKGVKYGVQVITVDSVAYIRLPRNKRLIKILESNIPIDDEGLKIWTEDIILSAIRVVLGQKTWKECTENVKKLNTEVEKVLRKPDGAFLKAGFNEDDVSLVIKEIKLSKDLANALLAPERERLMKDAADFEAQSQARKWVGMIFHTMALSEGRPIEEIQERVRGDENLQKKILDYAFSINSDLEMADRDAIFKFVKDGKDGGGISGNIALFAKVLEKIFGEKNNKNKEGDGGEKKKKKKKTWEEEVKEAEEILCEGE